MSENEWRIQVTALLAEVKANQENMAEKLDDYIKESQKRLDDLDEAVIGKNGTPGLGEEVRSLKGKWAAIYGIILLVLSAAVNQIVEGTLTRQMAKMGAAAAVSTVVLPDSPDKQETAK